MGGRSKWLPLVIPLALYAAGIACALRYESDWTAKQTWAVILTGVVLIWYTWETMLLRRVAVVQREAQLRPFVVFRGEGNAYVVENIGAGAALAVSIDPVTFVEPNVQLQISFPKPLALLRAGAVQPLEVAVHINGRLADPVFAAHLDPNHAVENLDVKIRFKNTEGKEYVLVETIAPNTLTIQGFRDAGAL
jgi:hypothetical protein